MGQQIAKPPVFNKDEVSHRRQIADAVRQLMDVIGANLPFFAPVAPPVYTAATPSDTRPNPTKVAVGSTIHCSDTNLNYYSNGTSWVSY